MTVCSRIKRSHRRDAVFCSHPHGKFVQVLACPGDKTLVIYTDDGRGFLTTHLSEEGMERICMAKDIDIIESDAHVSVCSLCRNRLRDTDDFIRVMRVALAIALDADL